MNFSTRSNKKELLDGTGIPFEDIKRNMQELEFINKYLGGHRITLKGFQKLNKGNDKVVVCEIGSGGGDNLKAIDRYCKKNNIPASFIGIDINPECIAYAKENCGELDAQWIDKDYRLVQFIAKPHIIFSSLFCHHFSQQDLAEQFRWMYDHSKLGFFVNDLHRHILAYNSIRLLTKLFSRSYLVKNDAPLSVLRGFRRKELEQLMQQYEPELAQVEWMWAFRWLMVVRKPGIHGSGIKTQDSRL